VSRLEEAAPRDLTAPGAFAELRRRFEQIEPEVQAFLPEEGRWDRLAAAIDAVLAQWPDARRRPSLFGLPVGIKDIFHVHGFATHAGTSLPAEAFPGPQSTAVTRLVAAGALIVGKTVSTEIAYFAPVAATVSCQPG